MTPRAPAAAALLLAALAPAGCREDRGGRGDREEGARAVVFASYNAENLFDAVHEEGRNDWEFVPAGTPGKEEGCRRQRSAWRRRRCLRTDWTEDAARAKAEALAAALREAGGGRLPDVLVANEVENEAALERWAGIMGYREAFITDSPDPRGIDNAVLVGDAPGLEAAGASEVPVGGTLRGILKVRLRLGGRRLLLYAHHWPARPAPDSARLAAARAFAEDLRRELAADPGLLAVSAGDLNVVEAEGDATAGDVLVDGLGLVDLHEFSGSGAPGTYYYRAGRRWNRLDRIHVTRGLVDGEGADYVRGSYRIGLAPGASEALAVRRRGGRIERVRVPKGFDPADGTGASDHWPVFMALSPGPARPADGGGGGESGKKGGLGLKAPPPGP